MPQILKLRDSRTGKVYQIPWNGTDIPTQFELKSLLREAKNKEEEEAWIKTPSVTKSLLPPQITSGVKRETEARRNDEPVVEAPPDRPMSIAPQTGNALSRLWGRFSNTLGRVNPKALNNAINSTGMGNAIDLVISDSVSPASLAMNTLGLAGAVRGAKGAINIKRAKKAFEELGGKVTKDDVMRLAFASSDDPAWLESARKALKTGDIELTLAPGSYKKGSIIPLKQSRKLKKELKLAEGEEIQLPELKTKEKPAKQLELDFSAPEQTIVTPEGKKITISKMPKSKEMQDLKLQDAALSGQVVDPGTKDMSKLRGVTWRFNPKSRTFDNIYPHLQAWVDQRAASPLVVETVQRKLAELKGVPLAEVAQNMIKGANEGPYKVLRLMMDKDFAMRKLVGDTSKYKFNYLPQMWKEDPETVMKVFGLKYKPTTLANVKEGKKVGINPAFTKKSTFQNYLEGIELGLTPKYDNVVDLLSDMLSRSNSYQANKKLVNILKENKFIAKRGSKRAQSWGDAGEVGERFLTYRDRKGNIATYRADPLVAKYIRNYLYDSDVTGKGLFSRAADWAKITKNINMGAGVPGTIVNAHGKNVAIRDFMSQGTGGLVDFLTSGITTKGAKKSYDKLFGNSQNLDDLLDLAKAGMVTNVSEDFRNMGGQTGLRFAEELRASKNPFKRFLGKTEGYLSDKIEKPLFGYKLPERKANFALKQYRDMLDRGMSRYEAAHEAADQANNFYGGMNYIRNYDPRTVNPFRSGGWSRGTNDVMNTALLAPDWTGTNIKLGKRMFDSLRGNADPIYSKALARSIALRNMARIGKGAAGYEMADLMSERPSESLNIPLGTTSSGKRREFPIVGTAAEMVRLPDQMLESATTGRYEPVTRTLVNRINPLTRSGIEWLFNKDYMGNNLTGEDRWGNPIPFWTGKMNEFRQLSKPWMHPIVTNTLDTLQGNQGIEELIGQGFELPVTYRYIPKDKSGMNFGFGNLGRFNF